MNDSKFPELKLKSEHIMPPERVLELHNLFTDNGIEIWLDGGWGVDALLEEQTRYHADLDIVLQEKDVQKLRDLLDEQGFQNVERNDTTPWNFVLGDGQSEIDVHAIVFDERKNGIYGPPERGVMFPATSLLGHGSINGQPVNCISPEWVVKFHTQYKPGDTDFHDVKAICAKFDVELPEQYKA